MMEDALDRLEAALSTPLASLALPARLANFVERRGYQSVADLARLSPEELLVERNLGRKSVSDARLAIQGALGASWEEARRELLRREPGQASLVPASVEPIGAPEGGKATRWESYRTRFAGVGHAPLTDFEFPARVHTFASTRRLRTLGELLAVPWEDFSKAKNVGRGTVAATLAVLESALERLGIPPLESAKTLGTDADVPPPSLSPVIPDGARWTSLLREGLSQLEGKERIIATQRSGLAGTIPTLHELGECFGVSRERIRQLESRAIDRLRRRVARTEASRRLSAACELLVSEPESVATRDALFAFDAEEVPSLLFFVNELLAGDTHALLLNDRLVYSRAEQAALATHLRRARTLVEAATFPIEEDELARSVASALDIGVADARALFGYLDQPVLKEGTRIVGFGRTREDAILATLRAAEGPLERSAIEAQHGRGRLPPEAIFVDHGLVSVPEKIEGWERWARRLPPLARRAIEREGPERQWSTAELVEVLATECDLPEWMNAWTLGSLLKRSPELVYLGRNVVALASREGTEVVEDVESKRVHIGPALEEILRAHGGPMPDDEAREALAKVRGVSDNTWNMMRMKRPFLLLDGGTLGLYPRDVPGGEARSDRVLGALYEWLHAEQRGMPGPEVGRFVTELGDVAEGITPRMLRSLARIDGRFRLSVSGAIGLAEWDSVRVPTQAEALEALLDEGSGSVAVETVRANICTATGEPLPRSQLVNLAISVGARVAGDVVVRKTETAKVTRSELVTRAVTALPERTAQVFERLLDEVLAQPTPPSAASVEAELEAWAANLRSHAATDCPHIELDQVAGIVKGARVLLRMLDALEGDAKALARTAIAYVLCTDDADTDLAVGGLDDDEAVLARVSAALGVPDSNLGQEDSPRS
ncbi:MAG: hypothetical protein KIT84_00465 [Labilithrix sp.]|nr:hypothetical protein [Labilithrix sp.]MCW5809456.1 hypothetical protein [Labilithrix sp.]